MGQLITMRSAKVCSVRPQPGSTDDHANRPVKPNGMRSATKPLVNDCVNMPRPSWVPIITNCGWIWQRLIEREDQRRPGCGSVTWSSQPASQSSADADPAVQND